MINRQTLLFVCLFLSPVSYIGAAKYALESDVSARIEYNDNIFVTSLPHDSVYGLTVIPKAKFLVEEANWDTFLSAKLRSNNYSDHNLDSNDIYLDASGSYRQQRNQYTLAGLYHKDSNLNALSTDFGLIGRRVNRELWSITPEYTRYLTERSLLFLSYSHLDVDYIDAEGTPYKPYKMDTLSGSISYDLTEKDRIGFTLTARDYKSKDDTLDFQLFETRVSIDHKFTELWSADLAIGGSRRNVTNRLLLESDFRDDGYVLDTGIKRNLETGSVSARLSRDNVTNSFGGLNEVDSLKFRISQKMTARWRYSIDARYEDIEAVSQFTSPTDREVLFFEPMLHYSVDRHWTANASYRYIQRKFKSDSSDTAPHSNRIYIGMTYNFPDISTF